jgi:microcystin-dependent protein
MMIVKTGTVAATVGLLMLVACTGASPPESGQGASEEARAAATQQPLVANPTPCVVGEIKVFAGNFVPAGWLTADGQLVTIASNTALFSVIGTTYGGDGTTNYAVPNLNNRVPIGATSAVPLGHVSGEILPVQKNQPARFLGVNYCICAQGTFPTLP